MIHDKVKIGGFDYKVVVTDEPLFIGNGKKIGLIEYNQCIIKLSGDSEQSEQSREQCWWHEVVHGIVDDRDINIPKDRLEDIVDSIAKGLYGIMKDNKFLLPGQEYTLEMR